MHLSKNYYSVSIKYIHLYFAAVVRFLCFDTSLHKRFIRKVCNCRSSIKPKIETYHHQEMIEKEVQFFFPSEAFTALTDQNLRLKSVRDQLEENHKSMIPGSYFSFSNF